MSDISITELRTGIQDIDEKIQDFVVGSRILGGNCYENDILMLVRMRNYEQLSAMMLRRLTFGTAGLRGKMGPGFSSMNNLVVVQTSQGIAAYLSTSDKKRGIVVGFDNRHNSQRFAELVATTFLAQGFVVHFFTEMVPTPFIPFSVKKLNCLLGIMITASHNPKDDNGYKVYGPNGAQIVPEVAESIQHSILENLAPRFESADTSLIWTSPNLHYSLADIDHLYFQQLISSVDEQLISESTLRITFTSLHGVSHMYLKKAFQKLKFSNFVPVREQMYPDPNFPTLIFPNPEEKMCLDLSMKTAEKNGCTLILANDPDVDRLAVAEKLSDGTTWYVYSGNEIGALLGSWLWKKLDQEKKLVPSNCCMISSTVSSKILRTISKIEKFTFYETLTGFKYMANKADEAEKNGETFVFAFEEAIGYMCSSNVMDKDGLMAALQITEMAAHAKKEKKLLYDLLRETYVKYGYHYALNSYFLCDDPVAVRAMFNRLRNWGGQPLTYPTDIGDEVEKFYVENVRDLTTGYDSSQPDRRTLWPPSPDTEMITFYFKNGCEATFRTSGTEPKVKYYTEIIKHLPEHQWKNVRRELSLMVNLMVSNWIRPTESGFHSRPE